MEELINNFKIAWAKPAEKTLLILAMVLPIAVIVLFKLKIFGLNKTSIRRRVVNRYRKVRHRYRRSRGRTYNPRR